MKLDTITAAIRPRRPWEAVDLGLLLTRRSATTIYAAWACSVLPVSVAILVLCWNLPALAVLLLWWLKPVFDRLVLHILSRSLFGAEPTPREALRALPGLLWRSRLPWALTLGRFDLARSYTLPVDQLEGLPAKARRARLDVLQRQDRGTAVWLTFLGVHFEQLLLYGMIALAYLLVPEQLQGPLFRQLFEAGGEAGWLAASDWINRASGILYVVVVALIEPFYVGGGFALYLNRRTHLEGWDLELALRRLAARLEAERSGTLGRASAGPRPAAGGRAAGWLGAALLLGLLHVPGPVGAAIEPDRARQAIDAVLEADEFQTVEMRDSWRYKPGEEPAPPAEPREPDVEPGGLNPVALPLEGLLWAGAIVLLLWLALSYRRWLGLFTPRPRAPRPERTPELVLGMEIRPERLPESVAAAALALWRQGQPAAALSLLYRGALGTLVHRRGMSLTDGATEGDCLRAVRDHAAEPLAGYFGRLTRAWQTVAYAQRPVADAELEALCRQWDEHFGERP